MIPPRIVRSEPADLESLAGTICPLEDQSRERSRSICSSPARIELVGLVISWGEVDHDVVFLCLDRQHHPLDSPHIFRSQSSSLDGLITKQRRHVPSLSSWRESWPSSVNKLDPGVSQTIMLGRTDVRCAIWRVHVVNASLTGKRGIFSLSIARLAIDDFPFPAAPKRTRKSTRSEPEGGPFIRTKVFFAPSVWVKMT